MTDDPAELEAEIRAESGHPSFEEACRVVAADGPMIDRHTMVVTREPFQMPAGGERVVVPPRSFLMGKAEFVDELPDGMREAWEAGAAPMIMSDGEPLPVVRGDVFGRDETVALVAQTTIPNPEAGDE